MTLAQYLRIWLASMRYAMVRTLMFRGDFFIWSAVEFAWTTVNLLLVQVLYRHTSTIAGWSKYELLILVGTAMIIQRLFTGFFWSNLFEFSRNVHTGYFDFFLAQPGHPLFMASTRKLDPDGLLNSLVGVAVLIYAAHRLGLHPGAASLAVYAGLLLCGLVIHYSTMVLIVSLSFWIINTQGIEGSYFTLYEFSRLPREAFKGLASLCFVYALPAVIVSNFPARTLRNGVEPLHALWLVLAAAAWLTTAVLVFNAGLKRYSSASS
jgi:ABC-2 type transport system permease protein